MGDSITAAQYRALQKSDPARVARRTLFQSLYLGIDGRWSTSKVAVLLWTLAIAYALLALFIADRFGVTFGPKHLGFGDLHFDDTYLLLLGGPFAAAVLARGITGANVDNSSILKPSVGSQTAGGPPASGGGPWEVISGDDGQTDLVDTQYVLFNLIALIVFAVTFIPHLSDGLPTIPAFLVALTSGSALTYVGNKAAQGSTPRIALVVPTRIRVGDRVTVTGTSLLGFASDKPAITLGGVQVQPDTLKVQAYNGAGGQAVVGFDAPPGVPAGDDTILAILPTGATSAVQTTVTVVAAQITGVTPQPVVLAEGTPVTITGGGFGDSQDAAAAITLGGLSLTPSEWQDSRIVARLDPIAAPPQIPAGDNMTLKVANQELGGKSFDARFLVPVALPSAP